MRSIVEALTPNKETKIVMVVLLVLYIVHSMGYASGREKIAAECGERQWFKIGRNGFVCSRGSLVKTPENAPIVCFENGDHVRERPYDDYYGVTNNE
jgi:hypothetical protein